MIWDWDLWPGIVAYWAWRLSLEGFTETMRQMAESLARVARDLQAATAPAIAAMKRFSEAYTEATRG